MSIIYHGKHKVTGKMYDVLCIANADATREGWPTTPEISRLAPYPVAVQKRSPTSHRRRHEERK